MRISKPEWLRHDADKKKLTAIFSVDFHPSGTRLATGGMDNKIRIWNTAAITQAQAQAETPRLLSTLTSHSGAVLCVRFSHGQGQYLASGADDMVVLIWEKDHEAALGNMQGEGTETWRPLRRLTGHESDVCDLAWSPGNRYLATCGLDNIIFIWDARTFERLHKLTAHTQFVKGLAFDPAGRFLASQSDDKTLRIWRTSDWTLHATIGGPFEDNIFSTYFRRPSWSPDGDCVAAANAANGKVPVAAVISRDTWTADLSFVGHRAAIEAVRFNPSVFAPPTDAAARATVCAAGGQDRGVSVWLTSQHMPITAATGLFSGNIMDLAWHTHTQDSGIGYSASDNVVALLAACSYDGTVALLEFTQEELGTPIAAEEQEAMLVKHGWTGSKPTNEQQRAEGPVLVESVSQVRLEDQGSLLSKVPRQSRIAQIMGGLLADGDKILSEPQARTSAEPKDLQPVTAAMPVPVRTKDGKRRVAPVFVRSLGSATNISEPRAPEMRAPEPRAQAAGSLVVPVSAERQPIDAPLWIEARALGTRQPRNSSGGKSHAVTLGPQSLIHSQSISAARVHLTAPRVLTQLTHQRNSARLIAYNQLHSSRLVSTTQPPAVAPTGAAAAASGGHLWSKYLSCAIVALATNDRVTAVGGSDGSLHWFDAQSGARLAPALIGEAHAAHLVVNHKFCLLLDCVGQLTVWDVEAMCALVDHVSIAPLLYAAELSRPSLTVAPSPDGDGDEQRPPKRHKPTVALTAVDVGAEGAPLVSLSDGRSYTYHERLKTWVRVACPMDHQASDHYVRLPPAAPLAIVGATVQAHRRTTDTPLGYLQELGARQFEATARANATAASLSSVAAVAKLDAVAKSSVTLDHLEHLLRSSTAIGSSADVIKHADLLARYLAKSNDQERVKYWLSDLLGPPLAKGLLPEDVQWDGQMASVPKRQLLERMLPILAANNRRLQSLVTEYAEALDKLR
ncbi:HIR complex subunit [Kickxella alabastrina]|nr:HIR complex subunit [Kickxella alabastrina]